MGRILQKIIHSETEHEVATGEGATVCHGRENMVADGTWFQVALAWWEHV